MLDVSLKTPLINQIDLNRKLTRPTYNSRITSSLNHQSNSDYLYLRTLTPTHFELFLTVQVLDSDPSRLYPLAHENLHSEPKKSEFLQSTEPWNGASSRPHRIRSHDGSRDPDHSWSAPHLRSFGPMSMYPASHEKVHSEPNLFLFVHDVAPWSGGDILGHRIRSHDGSLPLHPISRQSRVLDPFNS